MVTATMLMSPTNYSTFVERYSQPAAMAAATSLSPMFHGCGGEAAATAHTRRYALINAEMHAGMAISFQGSRNLEFDFLAQMIPHHKAASDMCDVWAAQVRWSGSSNYNSGIESLCYNITFGAEKWGAWQYDFSQPGEAKQMTDVLEKMQMMPTYTSKCANQTSCEREVSVHNAHMLLAGVSGGGGQHLQQHHHTTTHNDHSSMFMGCGNLHSPHAEPSITSYLRLNMQMHTQMAFNWTGNPDVDFLLGMLPHHQAALEMCEIYYANWACAPAKSVANCSDATLRTTAMSIPAIQTQLSSSGGGGGSAVALGGGDAAGTVSLLNYMHHICTGHIFETQIPEIAWMERELVSLNTTVVELQGGGDVNHATIRV
eukprot:g17633.t1